MQGMLYIVMQIAVFHDVYLTAVRPASVSLIFRFRHHPDRLAYGFRVIHEFGADFYAERGLEPELALGLDAS